MSSDSQLDRRPESLAQVANDSVYAGHPEAVYHAGDWQVVSEILADCNAKKIPVTFRGSGTSMTGASAADSGVVITLGKRDKVLAIGTDPQTGEPFVTTEPGIILSDLKKIVAEHGFLYPPDPTSFHEAQIGATIATNATGEDTFRFGPTRWYVRELEILKANGSKQILARKERPARSFVKNFAGYALDADPIDELIGSEGTLGLITKAKLALIPNTAPNTFLLILPFSSFANAVQAVVKLTQNALKPRALEMIGPGAGQYFSACERCPAELKSQEIFLYIKDDYADDSERDQKISLWFEILQKLYDELGETTAFENIFAATTPKQLEDIRICRHRIPLKVNEEFFPYLTQGGGKVGTDWWVPMSSFAQMMIKTENEAKALGLPFLVFAHVGNGHPHWNFLTRTPEDKKLAQDFVLRQCCEAVRLGGGVAGEHGIGKIKRHLLAIQHSAETIAKMVTLKKCWDPNGILGKGNIL